MRILVLGANGMLGHTLLRYLTKYTDAEAVGACRDPSLLLVKYPYLEECVHSSQGLVSTDALGQLLMHVQPDVVVNCVGLVKQKVTDEDAYQLIKINALFPHKLRLLCSLCNSRVVQISTDCVFSGDRGNYSEDDLPDASDVYGRTKLLGELETENAITIRTSIIGHEMSGNSGLLEWYLSEKGKVEGYKEAYFSGVTTFELSRLLYEGVLNNSALKGVINIASERISKYDLLAEIAEAYNSSAKLVPDSEVSIDRSLNGKKFEQITGLKPASWQDMLREMKQFG